MSDEATAAKSAAGGSSLRSDEPIRSKDDDRLARGRLVDVIGGHILATDDPESVVIALNAPWGAGKSSFLNLLEARLAPEQAAEPAPDGPPIVIRFNPWHYGSVEQLVPCPSARAHLPTGVGGR